MKEIGEPVFELPARSDDDWPHILRDKRLERVLPKLCQQWMTVDNQVVCGSIRIATNGYIGLDGKLMQPEDEVTGEWLVQTGADQIIPRVFKARELQKARTKAKAEVFTPLATVEKMVEAAETQWHGDSTDFRQRLRARAIEVACGEGLFITSRYNPVDGTPREFGQRVGILDRKLNLYLEKLNNNTLKSGSSWLQRILCSTYGVEYQGDNLLLARANVFLTAYEGYERILGKAPSMRWQSLFADALCQLVVQADALTGLVPYTEYQSLMGFWDKGKPSSYKSAELISPFAA